MRRVTRRTALSLGVGIAGLGVVDATTERSASQSEAEWTFGTGDAVQSSPTVVGGTVYVGSDDGSVYALSATESGSSRGTRVALGTLGHTDGWAERSPSVGGTTPPATTPTPTERTVAALELRWRRQRDGE